MKDHVFARGAEAVLIRQGDLLVKRRVKKLYRLPILDEKLRKLRTRKEAKLLGKAAKLIDVPLVKKVSDKLMEIDMDFVEGKKLSDSLDSLQNWKEVCERIGEQIAKLHDANIIHGDLTTSNMIYGFPNQQGKDQENFEIYFVDFGLGFESHRAEDKAVDLHLIKQALEAKHFEHWEKFFNVVLTGYKISRNYSLVIERFKKVEMRGRYKNQY